MGAQKEGWVSQIRKGVLEIAILGMLSHREMYASEIVESLAAKPELAITAGTVYPLLSRLRRGGVIDSVWKESSMGPPRKYYALTPQGKRELADMVAAWRRVSDGVDELLDGAEEHGSA